MGCSLALDKYLPGIFLRALFVGTVSGVRWAASAWDSRGGRCRLGHSGSGDRASHFRAEVAEVALRRTATVTDRDLVAAVRARC